MSKVKTKAPETTEPAAKPGKQESARETFESIVVAFVLAFLFRTFIAEAFVIPTGSMAPTLFGRHKDIVCSECQYHYEVGASEELDHEEGVYLLRRITLATCPNCRFESDIKDLPVFKGDRILVNKFPYEINDPARWDVCVFKFPENPERNYIKRMIGLPGEAIRISRGDVFARKKEEAEFRIQRKDDPNKQDALQIIVYDDQHAPRTLLEKTWPERWSGMATAPDDIDNGGWKQQAEAWKTDAQARTHALTATTDDFSWLRYRHIVPQEFDWKNVAENLAPAANPKPQLITDYCGYNTFKFHPREAPEEDILWVGDLTVSGSVAIENDVTPEAAVLLELVEGFRHYRCEIALATGEATLTRTDDLNRDGAPIEMGKAKTNLRGAGTHQFKFANVDDRLVLWIDGAVVSFGEAAAYPPPPLPGPDVADLSPVGIAVRGAKATVSELLLRRDIYYRAERVADDDRFSEKDSSGESFDGFMRPRLREALSNPAEYARLYEERGKPIEFAPLYDDEFFVMGDNSPRSQDSRLWTNRRKADNRHAVPRHAFVGKAFMIYWPHGIPFMNNGKGYAVINHTVPKGQNVENYPAFTAPFYPQFGRWLARIR